MVAQGDDRSDCKSELSFPSVRVHYKIILYYQNFQPVHKQQLEYRKYFRSSQGFDKSFFIQCHRKRVSREKEYEAPSFLALLFCQLSNILLCKTPGQSRIRTMCTVALSLKAEDTIKIGSNAYYVIRNSWKPSNNGSPRKKFYA